jgi:hypothetical protein
MRAVTVAMLLAIAACGSGVDIPTVDLAVWYVVPADEVQLGKEFPLTVTRVWSKDLDPEPWSDALLAPLAVELADLTRRESAKRVTEVRTYRARAFDREAVVVPARAYRAWPASGAGAGRAFDVTEIRLRVKPILDPAAPGPMEPPEPLPPRSRWPLLAAVAAATVAGAALWTAVRRRRAIVASGPPTPSARERALARLHALRERDPSSRDDIEAWYVEDADAIRDFVSDVAGVRAREMTTEEIVAPASRALAPSQRARLGDVLGACDLVKFARVLPAAAERAALLAASEALVSEWPERAGEPQS